MAREGDAFVEFHADTSHVYPEAERGVSHAAERLEDRDLKKIGHDFGETVSKSMGDEFEKQGPQLGRAIERGLGRQKVRTKVKVTYDKDNNLLRRTVETITDDIERAFQDAGRPGGPINRIGSGIADAIGAGFNVSGKSSLITLLIPVVGAIVGLVVGALQAINALVAVIGTIPALLASVGLQVGVLFLAFKGLGTAITGAFAATNAKELKEALKDLTPAAQEFVKQLLPLKDFFKAVRDLAQESFFKNLGQIIPQIQKALGYVLAFGFRDLAAALGQFFRDLALFFASPTFVEFVRRLFPATIQFLQKFGPFFLKFLEGLTAFSTAILPFLNKLGDMLSGTFFQLGDFLERTARSKDFQTWLGEMQNTLETVMELLGNIIEFIGVFLDQLNQAGGQGVIQAFADAFSQLAFFLSTPIGKEALEGIVDLSIISIKILTGLIESAFALAAVVEFLGEALHAFFSWLFDNVPKLVSAIGDFFKRLYHDVVDSIGNVINETMNIGGRIKAAVANFGTLLIDAGRSLIQGLVDGIKSKIPSIGSIMSAAAQTVRNFWPFSPAKEGPLSGYGDPMIAGQKTIQRFAEGLHMEIPTIREAANDATSNIVFGRGAIQIGFSGALPTQQQAQDTGMAVGSGINSQLAARDVRLAVRTL